MAQLKAEWTRPVAPFRIVGNVYYVGTEGIAAYLIVSGHRAVLLDATLEQTAPLIERNIEQLGFRLKDVKIILNSHAHFDHAGGIAQLRRDTGAVFYASAGDRWALEHGVHDSDTDYARGHFPPVHVDHEVRDAEVVALGDARLTATLTPGHTKGCTTWSTQVVEAGRVLSVVFPCSTTVAGNVLIGNRLYPQIARDFPATFATLDAMKADVVLTNHPDSADVLGREARVKAGETNAFVDPGLLQRIVARSRAGFDKDMAEAKARAKAAK
jgi:metallo-beta-lactamase class B